MTGSPLTCLCASCRAALLALAAGKVIRVPKPPTPIEIEIRAEHETNMRCYGMTEAQSIREIAHNRHITHAEVRSFL